MDIARGVAFVAMVVYHGTWFAADRGLLELEIYESLGWRVFQKCIAGSFFFLVGVCLYLANRKAIRPRKVLRRLAKLLGCAAAVTIASAVLRPSWMVVFGILHCIAACSVAGLAFLRLHRLNALLGTAVIALGALVRSEVFDHPFLRWLGMGTERVASFDFQPFFPWFGVALLGIVAGREVIPRLEGLRSRAWWSRVLEWLGQRTLWLYMAHVPVLVVLVEVIALL